MEDNGVLLGVPEPAGMLFATPEPTGQIGLFKAVVRLSPHLEARMAETLSSLSRDSAIRQLRAVPIGDVVATLRRQGMADGEIKVFFRGLVADGCPLLNPDGKTIDLIRAAGWAEAQRGLRQKGW